MFGMFDVLNNLEKKMYVFIVYNMHVHFDKTFYKCHW